MQSVLSVHDYETAAIGDRFRNILDIIDLLKGFDLAKLTELLGIVGKIPAAPDLRTAVDLSLQAFRLIAEMTPTEADDRLVAIIDSILTPELLDIITKIVGGFLGKDAQDHFGFSTATADAFGITAAERHELAARKIPLSFLFELALKLLPLLERFLVPRISGA